MVTTKTIKSFPNYSISSTGQIYNNKTKKTLTQFLDNHGYLRVTLCNSGKSYSKLVHRIVAENFIDNPYNLKTVNHKDENKLNNDISNLEWMTNRDNCLYGTAHKRSGYTRRKPIEMLDGNTNVIKTFNSIVEAEEKGYGKYGTIHRAIKKGYISNGYKWRYKVC